MNAYCEHCGAKLPFDSVFCPMCGFKTELPGAVTAFQMPRVVAPVVSPVYQADRPTMVIAKEEGAALISLSLAASDPSPEPSRGAEPAPGEPARAPTPAGGTGRARAPTPARGAERARVPTPARGADPAQAPIPARTPTPPGQSSLAQAHTVAPVQERVRRATPAQALPAGGRPARRTPSAPPVVQPVEPVPQPVPSAQGTPRPDAPRPVRPARSPSQPMQLPPRRARTATPAQPAAPRPPAGASEAGSAGVSAPPRRHPAIDLSESGPAPRNRLPITPRPVRIVLGVLFLAVSAWLSLRFLPNHKPLTADEEAVLAARIGPEQVLRRRETALSEQVHGAGNIGAHALVLAGLGLILSGALYRAQAEVRCRQCERRVVAWRGAFGLHCPMGEHYASVQWLLVAATAVFWAGLLAATIAIVYWLVAGHDILAR